MLRQIWKNARTQFDDDVYYERDGLIKGRSSILNRSIKNSCRYYKTILAIPRVGVNLLVKLAKEGGSRGFGLTYAFPTPIGWRFFYKSGLPVLTDMESGVYHVTIPFDSIWQFCINFRPRWPGIVILINSPQKVTIHLKVYFKLKKCFKTY